MIQADQDWIAALLPKNSGVSFNLLTRVSIFRRPSLSTRLNSLHDLMFANTDRARIEHEFSGILHKISETEPNWAFVPTGDLSLAVRIRPVLDWLQAADPAPTLDELSELAGMNKYQLIQSVKLVTGLTHVAWRQNQRIVEARRMLRDGHSLVDTANLLGFTDQSHFHRVFRAHVAATPGKYRN